MSDLMQRLVEGNERFVSGRSVVDWSVFGEARMEAAEGQSPFAVILTCADSRVPPEMIFDQGIGDLFVIRVAGNVVTPAVIGSVEFAVSALGTGLVVSMGHTACGAVGAAVDQALSPTEHTDALQAIVDGIAPAVAAVRNGQSPDGDIDAEDRNGIAAASVREHARRSAHGLLERSPLLAEYAERDELTVVPAEYDLASGRVHFL